VPGDWTDDTDQMILIMDTLLELKGDLDPVNFGKKLSHWLSFGKFEFQVNNKYTHVVLRLPRVE
jgi:ADP-ribosylglycohydrolase